ncbi:hypothetical protein [Ruegeria sp.]|uniref:hypothetical protein n=1 Tax=Ruegeria sp. TaxID=1879320 RepID=UPI003C7B6CCF
MTAITTLNMSFEEIERHLQFHRQVLDHLVRDFGERGKTCQLYSETFGRVQYLESVRQERMDALNLKADESIKNLRELNSGLAKKSTS